MPAERIQTVYEIKLDGAAKYVSDAKAVARANAEVRASTKVTAADLQGWKMSATSALAGSGYGGGSTAPASRKVTAADLAIYKAQAARQLAVASPALAAEAAAGGTAAAARGGSLFASLGGLRALTGLGAGYLATSQIKDSIRYATELQKVQLDTAAAIKSTGGAANVTAPAIRDLSTRIGRLAGMQTNTVQASENVLLSFTKVKNEVGAGNAVFDRASLAAANLSARLGTDLSSTSLQLGKALQAPIEGISALRGQGVLFTNAQVDQIKVLTASGNVLGAQKIILGQVEKQYGGAAAAAGKSLPAALTRLNQAWDDSRQKLTVQLMPSLISFTDWLTVTLPGAVDVGITAMKTFSRGHDNTVEKWLRRQPGGKTLGDIFHYGNKQGLAGDVEDIGDWLGPRTFTSKLNVTPGFSSSSRRDMQGLTERERQQAAVGGVMLDEAGKPVREPAVRVNWDQAGDPFDSRPVYLVADTKVIAQVVTKGMAKTAHAQGRGSGHK